MTHNQSKKKSVNTNTQTEMLELADKDVKRAIINMLYMCKKTNRMGREIEGKKNK